MSHQVSGSALKRAAGYGSTFVESSWSWATTSKYGSRVSCNGSLMFVMKDVLVGLISVKKKVCEKLV